MTNKFKNLRLFYMPLLMFIAALSIARAYFLIKYGRAFSSAGIGEIAGAVFKGLLFDLSTSATMSSPFMLLVFLPFFQRSEKARKTAMNLLLAWYCALLVYTFIDIQYYSFAHRHLTYELENTWKDSIVIFKIGLIRYLPEVIGLIIFIAGFCAVFLKAMKKSPPAQARLEGTRQIAIELSKDMVLLLLVAAMTIVLLRGGFSKKSLSTIDAFSSDNVELGNLSLNGIFTTFNTIYRQKAYNSPDQSAIGGTPLTPMEREAVVSHIISARETTDPKYPLYRAFSGNNNTGELPNVVLIIMESWSSKFMKSMGGTIESTPYFDKLSKEGLLFTNFFANDQRSFRGLSSLIGSFPALKGMSLGEETLIFQTRFDPIGKILKKNGYETIFVHAAPPSSMRLDSLFKRLGIDKRISQDDFQNSSGITDGVWGVYDEYSFLRANEEFQKIRKPFFGVIFSISSHSPYKVPKKEYEYFDKSVKNADFLNTLRYSDHALELFFENAKKSDYYKNTLFIITADHTEGWSTRANLKEAFSIPLLLVSEGSITPGTNDEVSSQIDLVPTIMDFLKLPEHFTSWGKTLFEGGQRRAMLAKGGYLYGWVRGQYILLTDLQRPIGIYEYMRDPNKNLLGTGDKGLEAQAYEMFTELMDFLELSRELITENRLSPANTGGL